MIEDGSIGILFGLLSLWRLDWNDPFARGEARPALSYAIAQNVENGVNGSRELRLTYLTDRTVGPLQIMWDASVSDRGGIYLGGGGHMEQDFNIGGVETFVGISAMVGLWNQGNDANLGFPVEFRTTAEFGVSLTEATRVSVYTDHRSHARLSKLFPMDNFVNRGLESVGVRLTQRY